MLYSFMQKHKWQGNPCFIACATEMHGVPPILLHIIILPFSASSQLFLYTVTWWLQAGIVEWIEKVIARQWRCKHVSNTRDTDATTEDAVFSTWSTLRSNGKSWSVIGRSQQLVSCGIQERSCSLWLAVRNLHCYLPLSSNDKWNRITNRRLHACCSCSGLKSM
jgi:hypothetical protein